MPFSKSPSTFHESHKFDAIFLVKTHHSIAVSGDHLPNKSHFCWTKLPPGGAPYLAKLTHITSISLGFMVDIGWYESVLISYLCFSWTNLYLWLIWIYTFIYVFFLKQRTFTSYLWWAPPWIAADPPDDLQHHAGAAERADLCARHHHGGGDGEFQRRNVKRGGGHRNWT